MGWPTQPEPIRQNDQFRPVSPQPRSVSIGTLPRLLGLPCWWARRGSSVTNVSIEVVKRESHMHKIPWRPTWRVQVSCGQGRAWYHESESCVPARSVPPGRTGFRHHVWSTQHLALHSPQHSSVLLDGGAVRDIAKDILPCRAWVVGVSTWWLSYRMGNHYIS